MVTCICKRARPLPSYQQVADTAKELVTHSPHSSTDKGPIHDRGAEGVGRWLSEPGAWLSVSLKSEKVLNGPRTKGEMVWVDKYICL